MITNKFVLLELNNNNNNNNTTSTNTNNRMIVVSFNLHTVKLSNAFIWTLRLFISVCAC